jgi:uncharacterized damage-inducible protein DinB
MSNMHTRPEIGEYDPYYSSYVNLVQDGEIVEILYEQIKETSNLLKDITDQQALFRYAPNKWSLKEVIGHMADTERIMSYRLLCIARGETVSLPGYDDMGYVQNATFNSESIQDLLDNFTAVRCSTVHLVKSMDQDVWIRRGSANGSEVTVRAIVSIIAGHELHHRQIIKKRYLNSEETN